MESKYFEIDACDKFQDAVQLFDQGSNWLSSGCKCTVLWQYQSASPGTLDGYTNAEVKNVHPKHAGLYKLMIRHTRTCLWSTVNIEVHTVALSRIFVLFSHAYKT